jgi:hypothetical protein
VKIPWLLTFTEKNVLTDDTAPIQEPRVWQDEHWTARVVKNEDDDGWAVAMFKTGQVEPALVGPWTMGRDKKNPKPLDGNAFITLVKTASEFVRRSEQQRHASLHQSLSVQGPGGRVSVLLDIEPDDDNPTASLSAQDEAGVLLVQWKVDAAFQFNRHTVQAWVDAGMPQPARAGQF